jgi:hypothetical protein
MATAKKPAKAKPAPLPVPEHVRALWEQIKGKAQQQLFHPEPAKRIEAATALKDKYFYYANRGALLVAAAIDDPDPEARAAMLDVVAYTGSYLAWSDVLRLRANAHRLLDQSPLALRAAVARCFAETGVPVVPEDLPWLGALLDEAPQDEHVFASVVRLVGRAASTGVAVDPAFALADRLVRHPTIGRRALWLFERFSSKPDAVTLALIELCESSLDAASSAALALAYRGPSAHDARAIAAIESYRDRAGDAAWEYDLAIGLIDRGSIPARVAKNAAAIQHALGNGGLHTVFYEVLSYAPEAALAYVDRCARSVVSTVGYVSEATMQRWVRGNPTAIAAALEEQLFDGHDRERVMRWWDQLRPDTAAADAIHAIERAIAKHPKGNLPYEAQRFCEACCALLVRVGSAPEGALSTLARLGARQVPHLVGSVIPTARAMHALGATEDDFAPIAAAYEKEAAASDKRAASDPKYDPATSWGAKLRQTAITLASLRDIASVRAHQSSFDHLWNYPSDLDQRWVLEMLEPFIAEPDVRALFHSGLESRWAEVQRRCATTLGLLVP